jgi:hypothetical protein
MSVKTLFVVFLWWGNLDRIRSTEMSLVKIDQFCYGFNYLNSDMGYTTGYSKQSRL